MAKKTSEFMPSGYRFLKDIIPDLNYVIDKRRSSTAYYTYFLARCLRMFEYKNLPDTIPHEMLDKYLMVNGIACITKDPDDKLRVFYGNLGGKQDCYYRPTQFIIANPHFKETFSKNCIVLGDEEHEGVLMRNDSTWLGLHPMLSRYSCLLAENTLTLRVSDVLLRITSLLSAPTDKEYKSALEYLKTIENGELGVIAENAFFDGVKMQSPPSNNGSYLTQFIEYQQYLKGSFYNEIGLSANYNMKREAIGKGESTLDQDALLPLCENMLKTRQEDMELVNQMYGTDISVDFSSSWKENMIEQKLILLKQAHDAGFTASTESTTLADSTTETTDSSSSQLGSEGDTIELDSVEAGGDDMGQEDSEVNDLTEDISLDVVDDALDEALENIELSEPSQLNEEGEVGDENDEVKGEENEETDTD